MAPVPDDILVRRVLAGDKEAFQPLMERHAGLVYAAIYGVLSLRAKEGDVALELMGDTFLTAYESLGTLHRRDRVGPWLYRIAQRKAVDLARKSHWQTEHVQVDPDDAPADQELAAAGLTGQQRWERETDLRELIQAGLAALPEQLRRPVALQYMHGLSVKGISEVLGLPIRTVERRVSDARTRLRAYFEERGLTDELGSLLWGLPVVTGADTVAHVMRAVTNAAQPQHQGTVSAAGATVPVWAAGASLVGAVVVALALVHAGGSPGELDVRGSADEAVVSLVNLDLGSFPRPPGVPRPRGRRVLSEAGDTLGTWRPVAPLEDATAPIAESELLDANSAGFVVSNEQGVYLDTGELRGIVTLEAMVETTTFTDAQASIGLVVAGQPRGVIDPAGGKQLRVDVSKHRRDVWVYANPRWEGGAPSLNYDGAAPDGSQAWVSVAQAKAGWTRLRLVLDTSLGLYDIYVDGALAARSVNVPATRGRAVTGLTIAASSQEVASAIRVAGIEVWVEDGADHGPVPGATVGAPLRGVRELAAVVRSSVESRHVRLAREALRELRAARPEADTLAKARRLVAGLEKERTEAQGGIDARLRRLRGATATVPPRAEPRDGDEADTAFLVWGARETDVEWLFRDRDWTGQGRGHVLAALPPDDYLDEQVPLIAAYLLTDAYVRVAGGAHGVDISLRGPHDLQHAAYQLPWDSAAADGAAPRREDVDALLAIVQDAVRHFAINGALPKADRLASHYEGTPQALLARQLVMPFRRRLAADMSASAASYAAFDKGLTALRAVLPGTPTPSLPVWLAQLVPGAVVGRRPDGLVHVTLPAHMYYRTSDVMAACRDLAEAVALLGGQPTEAVLLGVPGLPGSAIGMARVHPTPRLQADEVAIAAALD
jgi:RNA polymerase sigma-70 factor, ECF subfamily